MPLNCVWRMLSKSCPNKPHDRKNTTLRTVRIKFHKNAHDRHCCQHQIRSFKALVCPHDSWITDKVSWATRDRKDIIGNDGTRRSRIEHIWGEIRVLPKWWWNTGRGIAVNPWPLLEDLFTNSQLAHGHQQVSRVGVIADRMSCAIKLMQLQLSTAQTDILFWSDRILEYVKVVGVDNVTSI